MSEETILFHFYSKRRLSEDERLHMAKIGLECGDKANVSCMDWHHAADDLQVSSFSNNSNKFLDLRHYPSQLLYILDIHVMKSTVDINLVYIRHLEQLIKGYLTSIDALDRFYCVTAPVRRGQCLFRYFLTSDERLGEFDFTKLVEEKQSQFQNIKIYWGDVHGHVLYLDDEAMLAEKDQESYTRVLLGLESGKPPRNNFADKEVLILGGGDGGVLCELLKQRPRMVTMAEIDRDVVQVCAKYMREACEDALDTLEGPNKKIIIGDCLDHLHRCIQSGKKYDYIINDLTEFMINKEVREWNYEFATDNNQIMELALKALKPDGCYICRGGALAIKSYWSAFEETCHKLGLRFKVFQSFVPSFFEVYMMYEVRFGCE